MERIVCICTPYNLRRKSNFIVRTCWEGCIHPVGISARGRIVSVKVNVVIIRASCTKVVLNNDIPKRVVSRILNVYCPGNSLTHLHLCRRNCFSDLKNSCIYCCRSNILCCRIAITRCRSCSYSDCILHIVAKHIARRNMQVECVTFA